MTDKWMCSAQCACVDTYKATWEALDDNTLTDRQRTKTAAPQGQTLATNGLVPLRFIQEEVVAEGQDPTEFTYNSFADCFYEWKGEWNGEPGQTSENLGWKREAQEDFERINTVFDTIDMVEFLWLSETCHGVCSTGIFSFSGVLVDGRPSLECQKVVAARF